MRFGKTQRMLEAAAVASDEALSKGDTRPVIYVCATHVQRVGLRARLKEMSAQRVEVIALSEVAGRLRGRPTFFVDHFALDMATPKQAKHLLGSQS